MKSIKIIAVIMAVVLAGGVIASFVGKKQSDTDGWLVAEPKEHEECIFSLATGVVPASSDHDGKGYEYFSCEDCGQLLKVVANHESGHFFRTLSNGLQVCSCGAVIGLQNKLIGYKDFSSVSDGLYLKSLESGSYLVDVDSDGKYDVYDAALRNGQVYLRSDSIPEINAILEGEDDIGNLIDSVSFSFDFEYTGAFQPTASWDGIESLKYCFLNYQYDPSTPSSRWPLVLIFEPYEDKILAYDRSAPDISVVLMPDINYSFDFCIEPSTHRVLLTVCGGDIVSPKVLLDTHTEYPPLSDFFQMGFGRSSFYRTDGTYALYVDNLELSYSYFAVNEEMVSDVNYCDHDFTSKAIIDYDHPASEAWKKYTCKECGCWYYGH